MKKLLLTTALTGAVVGLSNIAVAQTTITGNLAMSYFHADNQGTNKSKDIHGFGKEAQINFTNRGKLPGLGNLDYVAGFSVEMDGADATSTGTGTAAVTAGVLKGLTAENTYIDLVSGTTTVSIGADHVFNSDGHGLVQHVGFGYLGADGVGNTRASIARSGGDQYGAFGVSLIQNFPNIGALRLSWMPQGEGAAALNDIFNDANQATAGDGERASTVGFRGGFGVKGLQVDAFKHWRELGNGLNADGQSLGLRYTVGTVSFGVQQMIENGASTSNNTGATKPLQRKNTTNMIGASLALSKDLSVGYTYGENKRARGGEAATQAVKSEAVNAVAIGYNMGPATAILQYKNATNVGYTAANDGETIGIYTNINF